MEEAFAAVAAGLAITCQGESAVRAVGAGFPQLRFVRLEAPRPRRSPSPGAPPPTPLVRELVRDRD